MPSPLPDAILLPIKKKKKKISLSLSPVWKIDETESCLHALEHAENGREPEARTQAERMIIQVLTQHCS